jgi:hypothetical protein
MTKAPTERKVPVRRRFIEEISGEDYLHKHVWRTVTRQLEYADKNPTGASYDHLVAMVFTSHALEGYLNFLGDKIAPELWVNEQEHFKGTGLDGKLAVLHEKCGLPMLEKGKRPYSTITDLKRLRDKIAHPKTIKTETKKEYDEGKEPPLFPQSYLDKAVTHQKAHRAMTDVKRVIERLHAEALLKFPNAKLGAKSLTGVLSTNSSSGRIK